LGLRAFHSACRSCWRFSSKLKPEGARDTCPSFPSEYETFIKPLPVLTGARR
jgi:hypothetical protein